MLGTEAPLIQTGVNLHTVGIEMLLYNLVHVHHLFECPRNQEPETI
jgi:hypothetical protein